MKDIISSFGSAILLSCLIFGTRSVQAFYNPSTGRWLSRDPVGEKAGENVYRAVRNNCVARVDHLGLRDFEWWTPVYDPDHAPVPRGDEVQYGGTSWRRFAPVIKIYQREPCCFGLMFNGDYAQVNVWWVRSFPEVQEHELRHVRRHFYPAYLAYKAEAKAYFPPCKTRRLAECLAAAIQGPLAEEWSTWAYAVALEDDCQSYGGQVCESARTLADAYLNASYRASTEISRCLTAP